MPPFSRSCLIILSCDRELPILEKLSVAGAAHECNIILELLKFHSSCGIVIDACHGFRTNGHVFLDRLEMLISFATIFLHRLHSFEPIRNLDFVLGSTSNVSEYNFVSLGAWRDADERHMDQYLSCKHSLFSC
jgi:hypothetical protein